MIPSKIGFIGLGHIGGSIAKTIHRKWPGIELIAYDTSEKTLKEAKETGLIKEGYASLNDAFGECQSIYLCAPVLNNTEYLKYMQRYVEMTPEMIITDVGSVKTGIHEKVIEYGLEENFIGGHPMCGTEHTGFSHSTAYMLENAYYIITPTAKTKKQDLAEFRAFTDSLDAITMIMDYRQHDFTVGSISHLPHVISATLVNLVKQLDNEEETLRTVAAGGFKDITRISSSSPLMWENICQANKQQILELVDTYIASLRQSRDTIANGTPEEIYGFFERAKDYRDTFATNVSGPIAQSFTIYCDLADEAGGIATIATILAASNISIKNIGITHNREHQDGALSIEFYTFAARTQAVELLRKYHYTVYD